MVKHHHSVTPAQSSRNALIYQDFADSLIPANEILSAVMQQVMSCIEEINLQAQMPKYAMKHVTQQSSVQVKQTQFKSD